MSMQEAQTQIEPKKLVSTQFDQCPHCGGEIVIGWDHHVSVITLKEYQERVQLDLKNMKEKRKHGN